MPIYEYQHLKRSYSTRKFFEIFQSVHDRPLTKCPLCGEPIRRLISKPNISTPKTNSELRGPGFTKLVRRDDGVYENVTARDNESRVMHRDKPET